MLVSETTFSELMETKEQKQINHKEIEMYLLKNLVLI